MQGERLRSGAGTGRSRSTVMMTKTSERHVGFVDEAPLALL